MQKKIISFKAVSVLTAAVLLFASCGRSAEEKAANQIIVFNYGDYIDRDILGQFEEETGIKVVYEEFLTPEAMYTKYKNGTVKYDLVCCSDYMVDKMIKDKEVKEIDYASMEHIGNIGDTYWKISESFDPGHKYTVPYFWGTVGILYNTTMMDKVPDSWNDLWDKQYKNNIIMQNSVRDSFVPPLVLDGCSINTKDEASLRKALDALEEQKDLVQSYLVDEVRDDMVNEQAAMAVIYSGEASLASEYNEDLEYIVPKEGTICGWTAGLYQKVEEIIMVLSNSLTSCAVKILHRRILTMFIIQHQMKLCLMALMKRKRRKIQLFSLRMMCWKDARCLRILDQKQRSFITGCGKS